MPLPVEYLQRKLDRRNYSLNLLEGVLYISSSAFLSSQIILPALVVRLGGGNLAVGSLPIIVYAGLFLPQVFAARYVETLAWKKPWAIRGGLVQRMAIPVIALAVMGLEEKSPGNALGGLLILYFLMQVLSGIATPGWYDFYAKVTPLQKRGRLSGQRTSLGSLGAFLCGFVLTFFLARFAFPFSYVLGFGVAFLLQMLSLLVQSFVVEGEPSVVAERRPVLEFLRQLPGVFGANVEFRRFIVSAIFLIVANMPIGFFTIYALRKFSADESIVGEFTLAMMSMQVLSALVTGVIVDRYGNKVALVIAATGMLLASLWALIAPTAAWFLLVFLFVGFNAGTELMARYNMSAEYAPVEQRSTYIALMNTFFAPIYLSSLLGGWISDLFGYPSLFGVGIFFSVIGLFLLIWRVKDPRHLVAVVRVE
jgi:MFS family permease